MDMEAFFENTGLHNDINVFSASYLFNDVLQGEPSLVNFTINNTHYTK